MKKTIKPCVVTPYIFKLLLLIGVVYLLTRVLFCNCIVSGCSMNPTYYDGDCVVASCIVNPEKGDVVVFKKPETNEMLIKRVIGTAGDTVQIIDSKVYVNGRPTEEPYVIENSGYDGGLLTEQITLSKGQYIVLGDNRTNSLDSRYFGVIEKNRIKGTVLQGKVANGFAKCIQVLASWKQLLYSRFTK